jgi:Ca2+-binding RTX toxin-like protein
MLKLYGGGNPVKIPMVTLAAFLALIAFNSSAQSGCTIDGVPVAGDPELIEGTSAADDIDCRTSAIAHDIYGYDGDDEIYGSHNGDFIAGGGGNDTIHGGDGDAAIDGGAKDDDIFGGAGNDIIFGGVGASPASGVGCVLLTAISGSSYYLVKGGSGDDTIDGGDGNDCIDAGSGEDLVEGGAGNDTLEGGNHADILDGGAGNDHIDGGWHTDTCLGGGGSDIFVSCELDGDTPPPPPPPPGETGTVKGTVKNAGTRLSGILVTTFPLSTFDMTNNGGKYSIGDVPTETVSMIAACLSGVETKPVTVIAGATVTVDFDDCD